MPASAYGVEMVGMSELHQRSPQEQLDKENSRCKENGEKMNARSKLRRWNYGLYS